MPSVLPGRKDEENVTTSPIEPIASGRHFQSLLAGYVCITFSYITTFPFFAFGERIVLPHRILAGIENSLISIR